jgi:hypothetical protein
MFLQNIEHLSAVWCRIPQEDHFVHTLPESNAPYFSSWPVTKLGTVNRSTGGHWSKRTTAFKTGKAEVHDLLHSGCSVMQQHVDVTVYRGRLITT